MLNLYRRHRRDCHGKHPEECCSGEFEERKKGWRHCACAIFASGTLQGKFRRKATGRSDWESAKKAVAIWEERGWDGQLPQQQLAPEPAPKATIEHAVASFLAERKPVLAQSTYRKYHFLLGKFKTFSTSKGYVLIEQWTVVDIREFKASWKIKANSAANNLAAVKTFFAFCVANEWLARNPATLVKEIRGKATESANERVPFSDDELKKMFTACETLYGKWALKWSRQNHGQRAEGEFANWRYRWSGQDLADFISVSVYTGLRISDVCTFHTDRLLDSGECHVLTTKTGNKVYTWIPKWLQERIRAQGTIWPLDIWRPRYNRYERRDRCLAAKAYPADPHLHRVVRYELNKTAGIVNASYVPTTILGPRLERLPVLVAHAASLSGDMNEMPLRWMILKGSVKPG